MCTLFEFLKNSRNNLVQHQNDHITSLQPDMYDIHIQHEKHQREFTIYCRKAKVHV
jgi:hypothetical protein